MDRALPVTGQLSNDLEQMSLPKLQEGQGPAGLGTCCALGASLLASPTSRKREQRAVSTGGKTILAPAHGG